MSQSRFGLGMALEPGDWFGPKILCRFLHQTDFGEAVCCAIVYRFMWAPNLRGICIWKMWAKL